ncbi:MAG: UvrD-helicase domain-containing protein [Spirochaetaceae bacterium]|nr:UvrD-helicase domain-containing protein [Spirochaetaceae bacterium]
MAFFDKIFGRSVTGEKSNVSSVKTDSTKPIFDLAVFLESLLSSDAYIARSQYLKRLEADNRLVVYLNQLNRDGLLKDFCKKNRIEMKIVLSVLEQCATIKDLVDNHNARYIEEKLKSEKNYLDAILHEVDPAVMLDDDQRKVILTDEDYCLVIAGAGAGKTTTVAAKVKYLVEKKNIKPEEILVVSFTNKAVGELKEKIQKQLKINCPITTFHSTGNAILHKENEERLNIVQNDKLFFVLDDYFKESILENEKIVDDLIQFFACYLDAPMLVKSKKELFNKLNGANFTTIKSEIGEFTLEITDERSKKYVTIQNEVLRSQEEVQIANFLYLNSIEYEYEPRYKFNIDGAKKPYTPDFIIRQGGKEAYIEHFGITQTGESSRYNDEELIKYRKAVKDKVALHRKHGTTLLYTFSQFTDGKSLMEHLQNQLEKAGFILYPRDNKEVMKKISNQDSSRYLRKFINLVERFILNFKTNGYTVEQFDEWQLKVENVRTKIFLRICRQCFLEYEQYLNKHNAVDFSDMINKSARLLLESKEVSEQISFKYIIVDEYQDISRQRFDLVGALHDVTAAKIIAVGDDWQSIYAFSGSDITLFTRFSEIMGYAELLKITKTYRNSQEVIDIAGNFIQKNTAQIQKTLVSPKTIKDPVIIFTYDSRPKGRKDAFGTGAKYNLAKAVEQAIDQIVEFNKLENKDSKKQDILLLGRFNFDAKNLEYSSLFEYKNYGSQVKCLKYPDLKITFMTAHASKGLGYDNVIVINGKNETYGFPSKIEDDPILSYVVKRDDSIDAAEERRLFYVAMTRTKNRVYFVAPQDNPSEFLLEIKHDYKNVSLKGEWNDLLKDTATFKRACPICGYPLKRKYKNAYGLNLWICMNDPEICDFMTNEIRAGKLSIQKCDKCDGYLIAKPTKNGGYFLGCTNYTQDNKGCDNKIWKEEFYRTNGLTLEPVDPVKIPKGIDIAPKKLPPHSPSATEAYPPSPKP